MEGCFEAINLLQENVENHELKKLEKKFRTIYKNE